MPASSTFRCPRHRRGLRWQTGFTLLELLVVLGIVGLVLAAAAPPLLSAALPVFRVKSAAREFAAEMRSARDEAIAARRETALLLDPAERSYRRTGAAAASSHALPTGVRFAEVAIPAAQRGTRGLRIGFFPDGSSTGGRFRLASGNRQADVTVDWLTGRVSLDEE
jgi:general secretion pathway protein H